MNNDGDCAYDVLCLLKRSRQDDVVDVFNYVYDDGPYAEQLHYMHDINDFAEKENYQVSDMIELVQTSTHFNLDDAFFTVRDGKMVSLNSIFDEHLYSFIDIMALILTISMFTEKNFEDLEKFYSKTHLLEELKKIIQKYEGKRE